MSSYIPFRLRRSRDEDIKRGIAEELERAAADDLEIDRSDIIRAALRFYFKYKDSLSRVVTGSGAAPTPPHHIESPAQGNEPAHDDLQRTPLRESIQDISAQQKADKFQSKPAAPAPYLAKQKR